MQNEQNNNINQNPPQNPVQPQPSIQPNSEPTQTPNNGMDTRSIITILLLLFFYPLGIIFMWFATKWPKWVKLLITLPIILTLVFILLTIFLITKDPLNRFSKTPAAGEQTTNVTTSPTINNTNEPTNTAPTLPTLKIPEYGVEITLSDDIKDAYYVTKNNYIYLKVHSLDTEPQCKSDDTSTAALGKAGKDEINPMSEKKYSDSYKGVTIGDYFYYTELAQYECATSTQGKTLLEKVRTAFTNASTTIKAL